MAKKQPKAKGVQEVVASGTESQRFVLVGTYKKKPDQLAWIRKRHVYNYPLSAAEAKPGTDGWDKVKELWLYSGSKDKRHIYTAEFAGIKPRKEFLAEHPDYPTGGSRSRATAHGDSYAVFRVKHKYQPTIDDSKVVVRARDFAKRTPKIAQAVKAYQAGGELGSLCNYLPAELAPLSHDQLRVCEAVLQLEFWTNGVPVYSSPVVEQLHSTESVSMSFHNDFGTLYLGDTLRWLRDLPSSSVDMIFADPPYSIGKADWDCFKSHEDYLKWCEAWVEQVSRILKDHGTCYICGFSEILADVKYRTQRFFNGCRWIVWHYKNKANLGMDWGRSHESLLHFRKSKSTVLNVDDIRIPYNAHTLKYPAHPQADSSAYAKGRTSKRVSQWHPNENGAKPKDVFDIPTTCNGMGEKTPHPTQKPEELVRKLVLASSCEGDLVLDPFSGSGTTAVVAQQLHRRWLACERVPEYNQWAIQRLIHVPDKSVQYWIDLDREVAKRRESIR